MNVEARLTELIGPAAGRLHTARSRNDQVATDLQALAARHDRRCGCGAAGAAVGSDRPGGRARGQRDAGSHPSPGGAADHARSPSARLCRDAGAGPRPARRCAETAQRMSSGRRRARRHALPDRPRQNGIRARFRPAGGERAGCRLRPRFRARISGRGGHRGIPPVAARRGAGALVLGAVRVRAAGRCLHDGLVDHAAKAEPRRGGACPGQDGPYRGRV